MSDQDLRRSARSALLWLGGASLLRDGLQFSATIVLARLLNPEVYGQAALAQTICGFLAVFSFRAFVGFALQSRDPTQFDWRRHLRVGYAVNALVFAVSNIASLLLWLLWGPRFGSVCVVLSIMSLGFLLEPAASTRTTWLMSHHRWRRLRVIELSAAAFSTLGGVALAFSGAGIIALAAMTPLQSLPAAFDLLFSRERKLASKETKALNYHGARKFGINRMSSGVVGAGVGLFEQSLMTSIFGFASLGLYNRAIGLANLTSGRIGPIVLQSLYPVLTRAEASSERFHKFSRTLLRGIIAVVVPAAVFLIYEAEPMVAALFGAKWTDAAALVPLAALVVTVGSMNLTIYQIMLANLQQGACLKIDVGAAISRLVVAACLLPLGVSAFLAGLLVQGSAVLLVSIEVARRGKSIDGWNSVRSIIPVSATTLLATGAIHLLPDLRIGAYSNFANVLIDAAIFAVTYLLFLRLIAPKTLADIIDGAPFAARTQARVRGLLRFGEARFASNNDIP